MPSSFLTIPTQQVFDWEYQAGDPTLTTAQPQVNAQIQVQLAYNLVNTTSPVANLQPVVITTYTDSNGYWQVNLVANTLINPANTVYTVTTPTKRYQISVAGAGPYQSSSIMVNAPVSLAPGTSSVGSLTVTGAFTVSGGPVSLPGGSVGVAALSGILPIANGGTGSGTKNFVDLTTNQTIAGQKTFSANASFSTLGASSAVSVTGQLTSNGGMVGAGGIQYTGGIRFPGTLVVGGTTLTTGFTADVQGNLRNATAYKARGFASALTSLPSGSIVKIALGSKTYDPNTNFNTGASNYTAPVGGYYFISGRCSVVDNANATQDALVLIYKNGAEVFRGYTVKTNSGASNFTYGGMATDIQLLNAGDVIDMRFFQTGSNGCNNETGTTSTFLTCHYLSS